VGDSNPYQTQTDQNLIDKHDANGNITSDGFNAGEGKVEIHPDGIADFISNLGVVGTNFSNEQSRIMNPLRSLPGQALGTTGYPDGLAAQRILTTNTTIFSQYTQMYKQAVENIRMMMQTIKDSIGGADDFSAVTVDSVNFATVQTGAKRPAGLPKQIGKTYDQWYQENLQKQMDDGNATSPQVSDYQKTGSTTAADGTETTYWRDQYGNTKAVTIAGGSVTTTVTNDKGKITSEVVQEQTSYPYGTITSTYNVKNPGTAKEQKVETGSETTYSNGYDTNTTTDTDGNGNVTNSTTVVTHKDGSTTTTTDTYDKGKKTDEQTLDVGSEQQTPDMPQSPVPGALQSIK